MTAAETCRAKPEVSVRESKTSPELRAESVIDAAAFSKLRRRALLEGCKWDPQVGDVETLSPFPLVMKSGSWKHIAAYAEQLAREAVLAEEEILRRPELLDCLGLPRALRRALAERTPLTPTAGRVMRFDFHPTTEGWRISEANSDVPGGFSEASWFTAAVAAHYPELRMAGHPADVWADSLATAAGSDGTVALLSAPGYMEDHQVIAFLAAQLRRRGLRAYLAKPEQLNWRDGMAHLETAWHRGRADVVVRFYQAEWLSRLPHKCGWKNLFRGGATRVANPAQAVLTESKRFPLVWEKLSTPLPAWRQLLPETRDPRDAPWSRDESWLLKMALCNNGDTVSIREFLRSSRWRRCRLEAQLFPGKWVAQRRFAGVPVPTPAGPRHVCVGVYTVDGRVAGAYTRMAEKPLIDYAAVDVALLLEDDE